MSPTPAAQAAPAKPKGRRGCLVFLAVIGVGALLVVSLASFVAWRKGWFDDDGLVTKVWRGGKMAVQGMNAPGTKELRAMGCAQAMVLNTDEAARLLGKEGPHDSGQVVVCAAADDDKAPSCNDVAETYLAAIGGDAHAPFVVTVRRNQGKHCTVRYGADGTRQWE
jgi:hypothetical protein